MTLIDIILLAVGLAMDCFSVSVVQGIRSHNERFRITPLIAFMIFSFGLFQGTMPLIGFYAGEIAHAFFIRYAGWVALILLSLIGINMIRESFHTEKSSAPLTVSHILLLAVATAIDAAVSGILLVPVPELLWQAFTIIAITASLFSFLGYLLGHFIGRLPFNAERVGGIILILIGLKICFLP